MTISEFLKRSGILNPGPIRAKARRTSGMSSSLTKSTIIVPEIEVSILEGDQGAETGISQLRTTEARRTSRPATELSGPASYGDLRQVK